MIDKRYLTDHDSLELAWREREDIFFDSNRHCLSVIVAFYNNSSNIYVDDIFSIQKNFDMNLSKEEIRGILIDWASKGYVAGQEAGFFTPTSRLYEALQRRGYTIANSEL